MTANATDVGPPEPIQQSLPLLPCPLISMPILAVDHLCPTLDNLPTTILPSTNELPMLIPALLAFIDTWTPAHLLQELNSEFAEVLTSHNNYTQPSTSILAPCFPIAINNHNNQIYLCWHDMLATSPVLAQNQWPP